jgi:hypothetical protein
VSPSDSQIDERWVIGVGKSPVMRGVSPEAPSTGLCGLAGFVGFAPGAERKTTSAPPSQRIAIWFLALMPLLIFGFSAVSDEVLGNEIRYRSPISPAVAAGPRVGAVGRIDASAKGSHSIRRNSGTRRGPARGQLFQM